MTFAQFEIRLSALEKAVERMQLQIQIPPHSSASKASILEVEQDMKLRVPPLAEMLVRGKIAEIETKPAALALSQAEWDALESDDA